VQYDYLKKFLKEKEDKISTIINEATYSTDKR
jgi:hypothetical protein